MSPIRHHPARYYPRANIPMNHLYGYDTSESSSSARLQAQMASPSQTTDLPDLYYEDENMSTPPSATSANMTCTTPQDWRRPWEVPPGEKSSTIPSYSPPTWDALSLPSQGGMHPSVAPIDTNFDWFHQQPLLGPQRSPMCFDSHGAIAAQELGAYSSSYSQPPNIMGTAFTSPQSSTLSLSGLVSPAALHLPSPVTPGKGYPPSAGQTPVKLHQPRPSRQIPIISLSKLASACDDISIPSHRTEPKSDILSPPLDNINAHSAILPTTRHNQFVQQSIPSSHYPHYATLPTAPNGSEAVILCNCGCMASYAF